MKDSPNLMDVLNETVEWTNFIHRITQLLKVSLLYTYRTLIAICSVCSDFLAMVSSMLYGMFVVAAGTCAYFADIYIVKTSYMKEIFNIILCFVGTMFIILLQWDIQNYVKFIVKYWTAQSKP